MIRARAIKMNIALFLTQQPQMLTAFFLVKLVENSALSIKTQIMSYIIWYGDNVCFMCCIVALKLCLFWGSGCFQFSILLWSSWFLYEW